MSRNFRRSVLDWAAARGYRDGQNPARWRGHLENLLPARSKVARVEHHAALPYAEIAEFMAELREQDGEHSLNAKGNFRFERTIMDWRSGFALDLRRKG